MAYSTMSYFVFGETVTAARINQFIDNDEALRAGSGLADSSILPRNLLTGTGSSWAWQSFTPSYTNTTVGNATNIGRYIQIGKTVVFKTSLVWGTTTSCSGNVFLNLPVTAAAINGTAAVPAMNSYGQVYDQSAGAVIPAYLAFESTTQARVHTMITGAFGSNVSRNQLTSTSPATWDDPDEWHLAGIYEAA